MSDALLCVYQPVYEINGKSVPVGQNPHAESAVQRKSAIKLRAQQVAGYDINRTIKTYELNTTEFNSNALTTAKEIAVNIEAGKDIKEINQMSIIFEITESGGSNSMILLPVQEWFKKVEYELDGVKTSTFGDALFWKNCILQSGEQFEISRKRANISPAYNSSDEQTHKASEIRRYKLDFMVSWLDLLRVDFSTLAKDLKIRLFPLDNGIIYSGSGTPSLTGITVRFVSVDDKRFPNARKADLVKVPYCGQFLEPIQDEQDVKLTSSTKSRISLKNLEGKCAFLTVYVRASPYTASTLNTTYDLGMNAYIDISNKSGTSLLCNDNQVRADWFLQEEPLLHFNSGYPNFAYVYFIPFCNSASDALRGRMRGYLDLNSEKMLEITPDASATDEKHSITLSGTPASGSYYFSYKGDITDELTYNTSTANMAVALNALPFFKQYGLTCSASATMVGTSTVITISGNHVDKLDGSVIKVINNTLITSAPANITVSSARQTVGRRGFTTGTYRVSTYAWVYRSVAQCGDRIYNA